MEKIKVVWICHFSNSEVRAILPLSNKRTYYDFAPWITNLAKGFEKRTDVELHIIAPHYGLKSFTYCFLLRGIYYHFFKPDLPIIHKGWPSFLPLDKWTKHFKNSFFVKNIINKINPDIVNLHGAENNYYSATILGIKIPTIVTIQGIYSNPKRFENGDNSDLIKIKIEKEIHSKKKYFGIFPPFFKNLIELDNPNAIFLRQNYVIDTNIAEYKNITKKYDFVYFGRITYVKGVEIILDAITILKIIKPDVSIVIIGYVDMKYLESLKIKIKDNKISDNVTIIGHLPTMKEVHQKASEAKISVISSKFDNLPGTIIESILLGIPVVATNVGAIPFLNKDEVTILLSEYGDISTLASNMQRLLYNPTLCKELIKKGKKLIQTEFNDNITVNRYIRQYHAVIKHQKEGVEIPSDLLFDENIFHN